MLHKPNIGPSATNLKSELDRLHHHGPGSRPLDTQPPDKSDQLDNETCDKQRQQLNQVYQRFQQHHNQQNQHSEPQHHKEEVKSSKFRNSHSLTSSGQHLKTAAMQLNIAAHQHHLHHHKKMYQKPYQHVAPNGLTPTGSSTALVDKLILQSQPTINQIPQSQASKSPSSHQQAVEQNLSFTSGPGHSAANKQPFLKNQSSSFARNHLLSRQLQENDLQPRLGHDASHSKQEQQERETNELFAVDRQLNNLDLGEFKKNQLGEEEEGEGEVEEEEDDSKESDTLSSLEKNLPVELSFLIRQQAYCTAKMNYLERQIRELKEACQASNALNTNQSNIAHPKLGGINRLVSNNHHVTMGAAMLNANNKNGNFIPSDDSGGEYSRATMSDDDELSSLLDQIAKSIRPDRCQSMRSNSQFQQHELQQQQQQQQQQQLHQPLQHLYHQQYLHHHQQQQLHQHQSLLSSRINYGIYGNPQQQAPQQYALINPSQLHHQAVPVFVMSSPITVAPHPSSINSSVPEVYFQPEPRYNQYYEDFYLQQQQQQNSNNPLSSSLYRQNGMKSRQFDGNLSTGNAASEHVAASSSHQPRDKRQIKSQLSSTDNWLKMRTSNLCNIRSTTNNSGNDKNCDAISSRQQQKAVGDNISETATPNKVALPTTAVPPATATIASVASSTPSTAIATTTTNISSSAEAGFSSSTVTEVENLNSVIEDSKR